MNINSVTTVVFTVMTICLLGATAWVGLRDTPLQATSADVTGELAEDSATSDTPPDDTVPSGGADQPYGDPATPQPQQPVASASSRLSGNIHGLHVLCPVDGGGDAHLLLLADTYYKATTPEEETRLATLLGPPVTNVDPTSLPPKSLLSVTDALDQMTLGAPSS
jgi:hypothetical protein